LTLGKSIVMLCSPYITSRVRCVFSSLSLKCFDYIYHRVIYDENAFAKGFDKIKLEKKKLELAY
jgi:hypothetical protein